jgi:hypothetical protein
MFFVFVFASLKEFNALRWILEIREGVIQGILSDLVVSRWFDNRHITSYGRVLPFP